MRIHRLFMILCLTVLFVTPLQAQTVHVVDQGGDQDFRTIQACINEASHGDTCQVNVGTYEENIDFAGKNITVTSTDGPEDTIIDGRALGNVVGFWSGESADAVLDGFTVRNGGNSAFPPEGIGAGIFCINSSPTIRNCTVTENEAGYIGGGILILLTSGNSAPTVTGCLISNNTCNNLGGGVSLLVLGGNGAPTVSDSVITGNRSWNGGGILSVLRNGDLSPAITRCKITGNEATQELAPGSGVTAIGGGLYCIGGTPQITACEITDNTAWGHGGLGGGIVVRYAFPSLVNCLVAGNGAHGITSASGGGVILMDAAANILGCTVADNTAFEGAQIVSGGGVAGSENALTLVTNSILWGNRPFQVTGPVWVSYSDIEWFWFGSNNIHQDPEFVSGRQGDYYLSQLAAGQASDSPCVDAGHPQTPDWGWTQTTTRTDHEPDTGIVDMGYHYH